jgi:dolichol-phosphate mannosyltransferase
MKTLVVLPTYNESLNVVAMLEALRRFAPNADVLVVDDASPDGTAELAQEVADRLGAISLMRRTGKGGLGSAYRAGFAWGLEQGFDALVEIDADFSHDPAALPSLLEAAQGGADVVIGSRYVSGGSIPAWKWHRLILSRGGNAYASLILGLGVKDATAGYRVYRADALRRMDYASVQADGYGFQIEMTYRARCSGLTIREMPISFVDRTLGESKMSGNIVIEALWLCTRWGVDRMLGRAWRPSMQTASSRVER